MRCRFCGESVSFGHVDVCKRGPTARVHEALDQYFQANKDRDPESTSCFPPSFEEEKEEV